MNPLSQSTNSQTCQVPGLLTSRPSCCIRTHGSAPGRNVSVTWTGDLAESRFARRWSLPCGRRVTLPPQSRHVVDGLYTLHLPPGARRPSPGHYGPGLGGAGGSRSRSAVERGPLGAGASIAPAVITLGAPSAGLWGQRGGRFEPTRRRLPLSWPWQARRADAGCRRRCPCRQRSPDGRGGRHQTRWTSASHLRTGWCRETRWRWPEQPG